MKIKNKIQIIYILPIVLTIVVSLIFFTTYKTMSRIKNKDKASEAIISGIFELNILTADYLRHPAERPKKQWALKYASITKLLAIVRSDEDAEERLLKIIRDDHEEIKVLFEELVDIYEKREPLQDITNISQDYEKRLIGQILIRSQALVSNANRLGQFSHAWMMEYYMRTSIIVMCFVGVLMLVIFFTSYFLGKSIALPITRLHKATEIIAGGNLEYKVGTDEKDEIGQLSRAFDEMTIKLKNSRAMLEDEITERKKAEEELRKSEKSLAEAQRIAHLGSWELDLVKNELTWSDEVYRIFGLRPQEFGATYEAFLDIVHPEDRPVVDKAYTDSVKDKFPYEIVHRIVKPDGQIKFVHEKCEQLFDEAGAVVRSIGTAQDITERKMAEDALLNEKDRLEEVTSNANCGLFLVDDQVRITYANSVAEEWFGPSDQIKGEYCWKVFNIKNPEKECAGLMAMRTGGISRSEKFMIEVNGKERFFYEIASPVKDKDGRIYQVNIVVMDITERKKAEEAIHYEKDKLINILDSMEDGVYIVNRQHDIEYINPILKKEFGPLKGRKCYEYFHDRKEECPWCTNKEVFEGHTIRWEWYSDKTGKTYDLLDTPLKNRDGSISKLEIFRDITERKKAEELIKTSLKDKEMLMQEIHHRVKNNLAVVTSLLDLQAMSVDNEHYREMFKDSISRIKSMALIHERLYRSEDLAKINFSDYISDMAENIYRSYRLSSHKIRLKKDIGRIFLRIKAATPCGLIVNELLSNCLKHAFPDGREGEITVSLSMNDKDEIELSVRDNGVGIPEGLDFKNTDSLGMTLINALTGQLQGKIELKREKGTEFIITFKGEPQIT